MATGIKAIIFDIDGTLTTKNSWDFVTECFGADQAFHRELYLKLRSGEMPENEATDAMVAMWQKTGKAYKKDFKDVFGKLPFRHDAIETISKLKESYQIALISGSFDLYAEIVAERLGLDDFYFGTTMHWNKDDQLVDYDYIVEEQQSLRKLEQLRGYCDKLGISLDQCAVVGDDLNDIAMFEATGRGVYIKSPWSHEKFGASAWKKIDNLAELKALL